jgi:predicted PurR-regulated permease PerM
MPVLPLTARRFGLCPVTLRVLWTLAVVGLIYQLREVLLLMVFSILGAYVLLPAVNALDRRLERGRRRPLALAVVYLLVVAVVVAAVTVIGVFASREASALINSVRSMISSGETVNLPLPEFVKPYAAQVLPEITGYLKEHAQEIVQTVTQGFLRLLAGLGNIISVVVVLILSFFFLKDGAALARAFVRHLPDPSQALAQRIFDDINFALSRYVRSMFLISLLTSVIYTTGLALLGVPYAVLLGVIAFPFEFIPMVGPLISGSIIILVALFSGYSPILWIVVFLLLVRALQDYVMQPLLLGGGLELSALAMVAGVLAGEAIGGIVGALLSVPVLAVGRILFLHLVLRPGDDSSAD